MANVDDFHSFVKSTSKTLRSNPYQIYRIKTIIYLTDNTNIFTVNFMGVGH